MDRMNLSQFLYWVRDSNKNDSDLDYIKFVGACLQNLDQTKSQNFQDIWVLHELNFLTRGFFVEFGATDGIACSNTFLLHANYRWEGILAEPNPMWHASLEHSRIGARISKKCVHTDSGKMIDFLVVPNAADLSTIAGYEMLDEHGASRRQTGQKIQVESITLFDLLKERSAPKNVEYLSIDTEGSELDILATFFEQNQNYYDIKCVTVEHNNNIVQRFKIKELMENNGYVRKFTELSRWDDFYVRGN